MSTSDEAGHADIKKDDGERRRAHSRGQAGDRGWHRTDMAKVESHKPSCWLRAADLKEIDD